MIAGLPLTTWFLILSSFAIGLFIVLVSKMINDKRKSAQQPDDSHH